MNTVLDQQRRERREWQDIRQRLASGFEPLVRERCVFVLMDRMSRRGGEQ